MDAWAGIADLVSMFKLRHVTGEHGQTMAEYGVVLSVVSVLVFGALMLLSDNLVAALNHIGGVLSP
jgi:Flp pilus assembly pilin Flp